MNEKEIENWISYVVENEYGHVNWKFTGTLSAEQLKNIQDKELGFKLPSFVIFYDDEENVSDAYREIFPKENEA